MKFYYTMWLPLLFAIISFTSVESDEERPARLIVLPPIVINYEDIDFRNEGGGQSKMKLNDNQFNGKVGPKEDDGQKLLVDDMLKTNRETIDINDNEERPVKDSGRDKLLRKMHPDDEMRQSGRNQRQRHANQARDYQNFD